MSIKIVLQEGPYAVCDTVEEAAKLLAQLGCTKPPSSTIQPSPSKAKMLATSSEGRADEGGRIGALLANVNTNGRMLLERIIAHPAGVSSDDLARSMSTSPIKLGGIMGGISKLAAKHKLPYGRLLISEAKMEGSHRYTEIKPGPLLLKHQGRLLRGEASAVAVA